MSVLGEQPLEMLLTDLSDCRISQNGQGGGWQRDNMMLSKLELEIKRLQLRAQIHEALLLKTCVALFLSLGETNFQEIRDQLLQEIEGIGATTENPFLSSVASPLADAEKATYAEEIHEVVDQMNTHVRTLMRSHSYVP
jgi:hypothetical protein